MKSFFFTEHQAGFSLFSGDMAPLRTIKSKLFITEVMFTAVVATLCYQTYENKLFDDEIGIFSFFSEKAK